MHIFNHQGSGSSGIARASAFFILLLLLTGCSGGDDDGRRLGDTIVGTWQRGTNPIPDFTGGCLGYFSAYSQWIDNYVFRYANVSDEE